MRTKKNYILFALSALVLVFGYGNCEFIKSGGGGAQDVFTGNPMSGSATIAKALCTKITTCNGGISYSSCLQGVMGSAINSQVGAPTGFSDFSHVARAESSGLLTANSASLGGCASQIQALNCGDPQLLGTYYGVLPNPFTGTSNVVPENQICASVFASSQPGTGLANYRYVRAGASGTGDGSDWVNACPDFAGACSGDKLIRGDTYYVASGNYGKASFSTVGAGFITIKRATGGDHGTDAGWAAAYDSGPAAFASWSFLSSNWIVDGMKRDTATSGYGFQINLPGLDPMCPVDFCAAILLSGDAILDSVTIRNTEVIGFGTASSRAQSAFYANMVSGKASNITLSKIYIHDLGMRSDAIRASSGGIQTWTVENSVITRTLNPAFEDSGSNNVTLRNNLFEDVSGNAFIFSGGAPGGATAASNWAIYGNIIYQKDPSIFSTNGGAILSLNTAANWVMANNTFVNEGRINFASAGMGSTGNQLLNNLFYNCQLVSGLFGPSVASDYNFYVLSTGVPAETHIQMSNSDPFVSLATGNFHLSGPTSSGAALPSPMNLDPDGRVRGSDGVWDRGAFEF